ncbi:MAG: DUF4856 domain-containing protein [Bacteroidetes bacterium]|nr:DUF4856 domain-containing protein [Bacteroidota bacterium]
MKFNLLTFSLFAGVTAFSVSCKKDDKIPEYAVPTTYSFDNVEYKESGARISMWVGYTGILGKSNVRQLSQDTVNNLWNNTGKSFTTETANTIPYTFDVLNNLTYNLAGKAADAALLKSYADSMVVVSKFYNTTGSRGVAGKIGTRIFNYTGVEFNQLVAKGLMGSLVLSNVSSLLDAAKSADNNTVVAGQGTAMQHNWDLAFGYIGIPKDYDSGKVYTNTTADRPLAVGGYFGERGKYIKSGGTVFEAFRKGRAAIGAKDYAVRDAAAATIKEFVEKTLAAGAYYYFGAAQTQNDLSAKFHGLSEGAGFIVGLKYRPSTSKLTEANYQILLGIAKSDFYALADDAANTKLKQAQSILTAAYGQLQP